MINFLVGIVMFFYWLFIAILCHEVGHLLYMRSIFPKRKIAIKSYYNSIRDMGFYVGKQKDYDDMTTKQYFMTNFVGVSAGLIFIVFGTLLIQAYISFLVIPYLFGSYHDIKQMIAAWKEGF